MAKASKSLGNALTLGSEEPEIRKAVKKMYTDPGHLHIKDIGKVEGNVEFTCLGSFYPDEAYVQQLKDHCERGGLADSKLKNTLDECLQEFLRPIRERRATFMADKAQSTDILRTGTDKAQSETQGGVQEVTATSGLDIFG